jgi:hypothetical protein
MVQGRIRDADRTFGSAAGSEPTVEERWTGARRSSELVDKGAGAWAAPGRRLSSAPTEVPLDSSPEVTPEGTLDSALDRPLDPSWQRCGRGSQRGTERGTLHRIIDRSEPGSSSVGAVSCPLAGATNRAIGAEPSGQRRIGRPLWSRRIVCSPAGGAGRARFCATQCRPGACQTFCATQCPAGGVRRIPCNSVPRRGRAQNSVQFVA